MSTQPENEGAELKTPLECAEAQTPLALQETTQLLRLATRWKIEAEILYLSKNITPYALLMAFLNTGIISIDEAREIQVRMSPGTPQLSTVRGNANRGSFKSSDLIIEVLPDGRWALMDNKIRVADAPTEAMAEVHKRAVVAAEAYPQAKQIVGALDGKYSGMPIRELEQIVGGDIEEIRTRVNKEVLIAAKCFISLRRGNLAILAPQRPDTLYVVGEDNVAAKKSNRTGAAPGWATRPSLTLPTASVPAEAPMPEPSAQEKALADALGRAEKAEAQLAAAEARAVAAGESATKAEANAAQAEARAKAAEELAAEAKADLATARASARRNAERVAAAEGLGFQNMQLTDELRAARERIRDLEASARTAARLGGDAPRTPEASAPQDFKKLDTRLAAITRKISSAEFTDMNLLKKMVGDFLYACANRWTNPDFRPECMSTSRPKGPQLHAEDLSELYAALSTGFNRLQLIHRGTGSTHLEKPIDDYLGILRRIIQAVNSTKFNGIVRDAHYSTVMHGPG